MFLLLPALRKLSLAQDMMALTGMVMRESFLFDPLFYPQRGYGPKWRLFGLPPWRRDPPVLRR